MAGLEVGLSDRLAVDQELRADPFRKVLPRRPVPSPAAFPPPLKMRRNGRTQGAPAIDIPVEPAVRVLGIAGVADRKLKVLRRFVLRRARRDASGGPIGCRGRAGLVPRRPSG